MTGRPKTVAISQRALVTSAREVVHHFGLSPTDRCLNVRPLFHINGLLTVVLATVASGGSVICTVGVAVGGEAFFDWVAQFRPTWYSGVPTLHQWVLAHGDLSGKRPRIIDSVSCVQVRHRSRRRR